MIRDYFSIFVDKLREYMIAIVGILLYIFITEVFFEHIGPCVMKDVIGMPCPTCGMTRAFYSLLSLDFKSAFSYHPLWWTVPIIGFVVVFGERPWIAKIFKSKIFWSVVLVLYLGVYAYRMITIYPNEPMGYNPINLSNLLQSLF